MTLGDPTANRLNKEESGGFSWFRISTSTFKPEARNTIMPIPYTFQFETCWPSSVPTPLLGTREQKKKKTPATSASGVPFFETGQGLRAKGVKLRVSTLYV